MNTVITTEKPKKSIELTKHQVKLLKSKCNGFPTMVEAAINIGVGRETLMRVIEVGRCNEITYNKLFA